MKICRFNNSRTGLIDAHEVIDITDRLNELGFGATETALGVARLPEESIAELRASCPRLPIESVSLSSPVLASGKVVAAPINYRAHVAEMLGNGQAFGHMQTDIRQAGLFLKASSSVVGAGQGIAQRFLDRRTDHEIELCAVIGRVAANVRSEDALAYVAGYCLGLDITVRGPEDRSFRKSIDTYCVLGPWLVTPDEAPDPTGIDLELTVNGEARQRTNTSDMVMSVAELIAYASSFYTLHPGDVLMTGTPQGVGPIRPGDRLVATGTGLGSMTTVVRAAE
jgi:2-keto-4-pentenoate hydratase/2-oxohepta-3-ene-1,7-dioic acid hydratase in catechol pathway